MKKLSILFCSMLIAAGSSAQLNVIANSPSFEEPEVGFCKIIAQENGNTSLIHVTLKEGITTRIYGQDHKQSVIKKIKPAYGVLKGGDVVGAYEIDGNIVLFIRDYEDRTPILFRLVIDGNTGLLLSEKEIGSLKKMDLGKGYAMMFGKVPMPDFYVRKDPNSGNYAVALFNSFAPDRNERIELFHYNEKHEEISRAYYQSPNDEYKYLSFQDMYVMGANEVVAVAVGMNTKASAGELNGTLLMGSLKPGDKALALSKLDYPGAGQIDGSLIRYNKVNDEFILVSSKPVKGSKKGEYHAYKTIIKRAGDASKTESINPAGIARIANAHYDKKDAFKAIPQNIYINDDGSYSIVYEEVLVRVSNYGGGGIIGMPANTQFRRTSSTSSTRIYLNDIGVVHYNKDGSERESFYIPKSQSVFVKPSTIYYSFRDDSAEQLMQGDQYKSFFYLNGKNKNYILLNDIEKNQDKIDDKKTVTTIQGLGDCDAYSFELTGNNSMPKRQLVFNDKSSKKEHNIGMFSVSAYDKKSNVLITLKRERSGREKKAEVVWMNVE